jgi:hypothetical protein
MGAGTRLRVVGILFAITILVITILDGFFSIDIDMVHSPVRLILLFIVFWVVAPWFGKYFRDR